MKTELEVARDAVRSAGLEELADALEWAAAAVKHRRALMFAAVDWFLSEAPCPECGHRRDSFESAKLTTGEFNEP